MGKKGSWLSAIKRVFVPNSKEKLEKRADKKSSKEKKRGQGILEHGETKSFIPLFRGPSSIEKILGEADLQQIQFRPPTPYEQPSRPSTPYDQPKASSALPSKPPSPRNASLRVTSPRALSPKVTSPKAVSPRAVTTRGGSNRSAPPRVFRPRPEPTLRNQQLAATKIQAAFRGYMARRSFRALRGLVRLQGVVRGQNVKRQTVNAMKHLQLLVRVQSQIQSRRIQMLENQAVQHAHKNDTDLSEAGDQEDWDDSLLTKEEVDARMQKKLEAIVKRERAMAYAYSQQLMKGNQKPDQTPLLDIKSAGLSWWWTYLERQIPTPTKPAEPKTMKSFLQTPATPIQDNKRSPRPQSTSYKHQNSAYDNLQTPTPKSSKSTVPSRTRQFFTPTRTPPTNNSNLMKFPRPRHNAADSPFDVALKDDDSLMSCPPFSVPNYMTPTASAQAKVRPNSNPKERLPGTPGSETSKRRFSFPMTPSIGSFKWNKGSNKDASSQKVVHQQMPLHSVGDRSIDSATSMPAVFGRKPFNRFV